MPVLLLGLRFSLIGNNTSIRHSGIGQDRHTHKQTTVANSTSTLQICIGQVGTIPNSLTQISPSQIGISKVRSIQGALTKSSSTKIRTTQIGFEHINIVQNSIFEIRTTQIRPIQFPSQDDLPQIGISKITPNETSKFQVASTEIYSTQVESHEFPLPSSITLQKFLSSHNYDRKNTIVPILSDLLFGDNPFNLDLAIEDLQTGQLAEAEITGCDSTGRPNSGILTLDYNANSKGWFLDTTP